MALTHRTRRSVLVLEDVRETATLIRSLLTNSGFHVTLATDEQDAITRARADVRDVMVISLGLNTNELIATANRIREHAQMRIQLPIVIFCVPTIPEGTEIEVRTNTYLARPNDFNQLRKMLGRLISDDSRT